MKRNWFQYLTTAFVAAMFALNAAAADKLEQYKKEKEEFQLAQKAVATRANSTESTQKELDRLTEQKTTAEREIAYYKSKLTAAQAKLDAATASAVVADVEKAKQEVAMMESRVKNAEGELEKVTSQTKGIIEGLQRSLSDSVESNLILPGESVEVMVMEDDSFNGVYQVRRGGYIIMPRVGRVSLVGKDLAGSEKAIKEALMQGQIKEPTVMVERPEGSAGGSGPVIYLAGEFRNPGPWRIPQGVAPTVVTTILRSGGVTESADLTRVRVLRLVSGQPLVEEVNVQAILDGTGLSSDLALSPGDIIMVPAYANVVYVTGNVQRPGTLKILPDDELTAYSAVLRCGGFARFANRSKVYVLRDRANGQKQKIPVSIKDIQAGRGQDVILEPKDIVVIPEKFFSF